MLNGRHVTLRPSVRADAADLLSALREPKVFAGAYHGGAPFADVNEVAEWIDAARTTGRLMYTVSLVAGRVVGTTSLGDIDRRNRAAHVGWTAYSPDVWGTAVNPECKLLLLSQVFDAWAFERVKIQTDAINTHSQAAIAKLGAVREGVLRHHRVRADGSWRDTVVFSILADEWPTVRAGLERRLQRPSLQR